MSNKNKIDLNDPWLKSQGEPVSTSLTFEPDEFREYIEHFDLSEEQENELLETVWHIMKTFVELGFGLDSVQNIFYGIVENALQLESDSVEEKDHTKQIAAPKGNNEKGP